MRFKNKLLSLCPIRSKSYKKGRGGYMRTKISTDTVRRANRRLIFEKGKTNTIPSNEAFNVSVRYRGRIISQSIPFSTAKSNYQKSLSSVRNGSKL